MQKSDQFEVHPVEWSPQAIGRFWDFHSNHPVHRHTYFGKKYGRQVAKVIDQVVGFKKVSQILDFSCGPGDVIEACLPYLGDGQQIYGSDFGEVSVESLQQRLGGEAHFGGALLLRDFPSEFDSGQFDLLMATEVVEHLGDDELEAMLRECHRLLKPGGRLFLTTPHQENLAASEVMCPECGCVFHKMQHRRSWQVATLSKAVEAHGFRTELCYPRSWKKGLSGVIANWRKKKQNRLLYCGVKGS